METHFAIKQEHPTRLQEYGVGIFDGIPTKSALKKAIKKGLILVDGKISTTATFIKGKEVITYYKPEENKTKKKLVLDLEVLYEDDYLAIINKPAGILVSGNTFKTIDNALEQNLAKSNRADATKPRPVHRLDYPTTGVLLIGKTTKSIIALNKLFENKEISKTYFAITIGEMKKEGLIDSPLDGKKAISHFKVLASVTSKRFGYLNLVQLNPKTGRKHQLRKHLASIGNPILGDKDYGILGEVLKGKGLYLHAYSLKFTHPFTNEPVTIAKEFPKKFGKVFPEIKLEAPFYKT